MGVAAPGLPDLECNSDNGELFHILGKSSRPTRPQGGRLKASAVPPPLGDPYVGILCRARRGASDSPCESPRETRAGRGADDGRMLSSCESVILLRLTRPPSQRATREKEPFYSGASDR